MSASQQIAQPGRRRGRVRLLVELEVGEDFLRKLERGSGSSNSVGAEADAASTKDPEPQGRTLRSAKRAAPDTAASTVLPSKRQKQSVRQSKRCERCQKQHRVCTHLNSESSSPEEPIRTTGLGKGKAPLTGQQWVTFPDVGPPVAGLSKPTKKRGRPPKNKQKLQITLPAAVTGNPYSHLGDYGLFYSWFSNPENPADFEDKMLDVFPDGPIEVDASLFIINPHERMTPPPRPFTEQSATATSNDVENGAGLRNNVGETNNNTDKKWKSYGGYRFEFDSDLESE